MCGRFTQHYTGHAFLSMFGPPRNLQPHYNIAPTDVVEVIRPCGSTLIAIEPRLLLLDEPFGALDAKVRKSLRLWLRQLHDRMGLTSIFVTHDQAEAMEMADRVAVLRAGDIVQVDAPDKLYSDPGSAFVHEFLGESVRLDCTVSGNLVHIEGLQDVAFVTDCPPGPAMALIRPHEVELSPGPGPARVESVHVNGPMCRLRIVVGGQALEVLRPEDAWIPIAGQTCNIDLSRARIYARTN